MIHAALLTLFMPIGGGDAPEAAPGSWLSLDRELALLQQAPGVTAKPIGLSGYIKTSFRQSDDFLVMGEDRAGFELNNVRLNVRGQVGDFDVRMSADFASGGSPSTGEIRDAFARFPVAENVHVQMGNFKSPFLFSGLESDELQVFYERTSQGRLWSGRELGLLADARLGPVWLFAAAQNGGDGQGDELLLVARALYAIGEPITRQSGCYGPDCDTRATFSLAWLSDESADDAQAISAEALVAHGAFWFQAEVVDYDDGFDGIDQGNASAVVPSSPTSRPSQNDTTPWGLTLAYMLSPMWEVALRYEDLDDDDDTTRVWAGVNIYLEGQRAKWQVSYIDTDSDAAAFDGDEVRVGLVVSI